MHRRIALAAGLAVFIAAAVAASVFSSPRESRTAFGGLVLVEQARAASPAVDSDAAGRAAMAKLSELEPSLRGLAIHERRLAPGLTRAEDATGRIVHTAGRPTDAWVFQIDAPAQDGYAAVSGLVVVDALSGEVLSAQLLQTND